MPTALDSKSCRDSSRLCGMYRKSTKRTSQRDGQEYRTVVQIVLRIPERRIAWQAMPDNFPRGVVLFEPLSNRTTEITVRLRSSIESATLAKATRDYLTNFKRVVEEQ